MIYEVEIHVGATQMMHHTVDSQTIDSNILDTADVKLTRRYFD